MSEDLVCEIIADLWSRDKLTWGTFRQECSSYGIEMSNTMAQHLWDKYVGREVGPTHDVTTGMPFLSRPGPLWRPTVAESKRGIRARKRVPAS